MQTQIRLSILIHALTSTLLSAMSPALTEEGVNGVLGSSKSAHLKSRISPLGPPHHVIAHPSAD